MEFRSTNCNDSKAELLFYKIRSLRSPFNTRVYGCYAPINVKPGRLVRARGGDLCQ